MPARRLTPRPPDYPPPGGAASASSRGHEDVGRAAIGRPSEPGPPGYGSPRTVLRQAIGSAAHARASASAQRFAVPKAIGAPGIPQRSRTRSPPRHREALASPGRGVTAECPGEGPGVTAEGLEEGPGVTAGPSRADRPMLSPESFRRWKRAKKRREQSRVRRRRREFWEIYEECHVEGIMSELSVCPSVCHTFNSRTDQ